MGHASQVRSLGRFLCKGLLLGTIFSLGISGCGDKTASKKKDVVQTKKRATKKKTETKSQGLVFRLSEGAGEKKARKAQQDGVKRAAGRALSSQEIAHITARLPTLKGLVADQKAFAFRARSLPAPRTGKTLHGTFPPPQKIEKPGAGKPGVLKVLRTAPQDRVGLAPNLSVTFSQPMVALTSHADTIALGVPVKLTPAIPGAWRWVGTKTLLFQPKPRFPMATRVTAEIVAGTKSVLGGKLTAAKRWQFSTPPPRLLTRWPRGGTHRRDVAFFVSFDQKIDSRAVFEKLRLSPSGKKDVAIRLLTPAEVKENKRIAGFVKRAMTGRWIAFRAKELLEADTRYTVTVGVGTPSAEGPLKTKSPQHFSFHTYAPLKIAYQSCSKRPCKPLSSIYVRFNNRLDGEAFSTKSITVSPPIPRMRVQVANSSIRISGETRGRTTYKLSLPREITDIYGQTLGAPGPPRVLSFPFGKARPRLMAPGGNFRVLDPRGKKAFFVHSINLEALDVAIYKVRPEDWLVYLEWRRQGMRKEVPEVPPGKLVVKKVLRPGGKPDTLVRTMIDLSPALTEGEGQVVVWVKERPLAKKIWKRQMVSAWLQATDLALDAFADPAHLVAWVTRLADGKAVKGAKVQLMPDGPQGVSGPTGLARLDLSASPRPILVARLGEKTVMLPQNLWGGRRSGWQRHGPRSERVRWYVFDDRKLYRPKETVNVKGWVRLVNMGQKRGVRFLPSGAKIVRYYVFGPRGNKIAKGETALGKLGGFSLHFALPDKVNLGRASLRLMISNTGVFGGAHRHRFRIQEFRRPEFEVSATGSSGPHFIGGRGLFTAQASYFSGGGLANAEVRWRVTARAGSFTPPNRGAYTFGTWSPSWWRYQGRGGRRGRFKTTTQTYEGRTDAHGKHRLRLDFDAVDPPRPVVVRGAATIKDVNRQTWTAQARILVHPAALYVGLKTQRYFVERGKPLKVEAIVSDIDGKLVSGTAMDISAVRVRWGYVKGRYTREEVDRQACATVSGAKAVTCVFQTEKGGTYLIRSAIKDKDGRTNTSSMTRWVSGGKRLAKKRLKKESVRLIADKKRYAPGETAEVLVQAPFADAEGFLTILRDGIVRSRRFAIKGTSTVLTVKIDERAMPALALRVNLVGKAPRVDEDGEVNSKLPPRPAFASGSLSLPVPPRLRRLKVAVDPKVQKLSPGSKTVIGVTVRDAAGAPVVGAGVAVVVVDESVLALTGYRLADPLYTFYPTRSARMWSRHLRAHVWLADPNAIRRSLEGAGGRHEQRKMDPSVRRPRSSTAPRPRKKGRARAPGRAAGVLGGLGIGSLGKVGGESYGIGHGSGKKGKAGASAAVAKIAVRTNFAPLALFAPALTTDASGKVSVPFKLPDNLTRYRVMAVAVSGSQFYGKGEGTIRARLPLMIRPLPPRFMNFGDVAELPIVLHNQTADAQTVQVALRATNVEIVRGAGREVTIPAEDRVEVRFPVKAISAGTARFQLGIVAGKFTDAASFSLPVWTPATTEAFATYGTVDKGAIVQPVAMPTGVIPQFGGLQITTSSTALQALSDAVLYLVSYPYECSEQLSSRVLAVAALKDVIRAFSAPGLPKPAAIVATVGRDLKRLSGMQNNDGGFPLWVRGKRSWPFLSVHVTHALLRAKAKGFPVPERMLKRALAYLHPIKGHFPSSYGIWTRRIISAYALYVRALAGDRDVVAAKVLLPHFMAGPSPYFEGIGWLYPVLSGAPSAKGEIAKIRKLLSNRVTETASTAHFVTSYSDEAYLILHSDRRVDGILLEGLITDQPRSDLIVKIVRGLLAHRKRGHWSNTQENAWVLLALDRYFKRYEKVTPSFVARVWLGKRFAGQHAFRGRTTERHAISIPMAVVAKAGTSVLTVAKQGPGRLYYRLGMRYAPGDLKPPPADHGFTVRRRYEAVDDAKDVRRDKDGTWRVKAGSRVRVVLTLVAPTRRYHVALVDPLPAGLEALNPALRGTQSFRPGAGGTSLHGRGRGRGWGRFPGGRRPAWRRHYWRGWGQWYEHTNLRDERAEAFSSLLWGGVYTYKYIARATTPG
ncbi:MAG: hypothetical protein KAI47_10445, partial [Deltaproteobacteria bacterium]|nr:hypothetical protein [Deltaproteobacteria bacterium]